MSTKIALMTKDLFSECVLNLLKFFKDGEV